MAISTASIVRLVRIVETASSVSAVTSVAVVRIATTVLNAQLAFRVSIWSNRRAVRLASLARIATGVRTVSIVTAATDVSVGGSLSILSFRWFGTDAAYNDCRCARHIYRLV